MWDASLIAKPQPQLRSHSGPSFSIGDPALAAWLGIGASTQAGTSVTETSALGLTAVYRSVSIISGTIAGLPLKTYRTLPDGTRERVSTFLDNPHPSLTPFEWVETVLVHLLLWGNAYLLHIYGGAGQVLGLQPLHPSAVTVELDADGHKLFTVALQDGKTRPYGEADLTHIPALGTDGVRGLSPISACREAIGTGLAGDAAAARMFGNGLTVSALVSAEAEQLDENDAKTLVAGLKSRLTGTHNAGDVAFVNANIKVQQLAMTAEDAQFLEGRTFQIDEVSRLYGVPKVLLSQDGASTWGTGIAELNRGLAKYTLMAWTSRVEQKLSRLLSRSTTCEFDYAGLFQGTPQEEIELLALQVEKGLLTANEARAIRNLPPLPEAPPPPDPQPEVRSAVPGESMTLELRQEATVVNVPAPVVNVTVEPTPVAVEVAAPNVTVQAPKVDVRNEVTVPPPGERQVTFKRDGRGLIVSAEIEDD